VNPVVPNNRVDIADVANIVDAFKNLAYPFTGPVACPQSHENGFQCGRRCREKESVHIRDIAALVDCFKELPTALPLVVCDLAPETPDKRIDIRDVSAGVDAFKGLQYPYSAPTSCP
jgi:hypothetical protein